MNVIASGVLHSKKNKLGGVLEGVEVTKKGIPALTKECTPERCEVVQKAEIEKEELMLQDDVADTIESLLNPGRERGGIDLVKTGKFIADQILNNTIDKNGII